MQPDKRINLSSRVNSFGYALKGLLSLLKQEPNAIIHLLATIAVIIAGFIKHIAPSQWVAVVFAIGIVWICEAFNTAIEMLCDLYSKENNLTIKKIKDISAAAVLIASIVSVVIGIIVFSF